uniref:Uncharacterized protein n=1 Tax=Arundo donax TaxID=35708 RepID=A0A0A9PWC4_ARUDO
MSVDCALDVVGILILMVLTPFVQVVLDRSLKGVQQAACFKEATIFSHE